MTRYLLDSNALIRFARGTEPARSTILALLARQDELGVCAVNIAEFYSGQPRGRHPDVDLFIDLLRLWPITFDDAIRAGTYRLAFRHEGRTLSLPDMLIAAVARREDAILLTENVRDFPMDDLDVQSLASR